jgi:uncharacterized protein YndB with AHSA1/START domain
MIKKIGFGCGLLIVVFLGVVATRPDTFRIERSASIAAPPEVIFPFVSDFHHWEQWSPWEKLDPKMKKTHEGPAGAQGSRYSWVGNKDVGEGRMTLVDVKPSDSLSIKLEFLKPFEATNATTFTFKPAAGGTQVTWAMEGHPNFMMKAFSLFADMDARVGKDFESGLGTLKGLAEAEAKRVADEAAKKAAEEAAKKAAEEAAKKAAEAVAAAAPPAPAKGKKK